MSRLFSADNLRARLGLPRRDEVAGPASAQAPTQALSRRARRSIDRLLGGLSVSARRLMPSNLVDVVRDVPYQGDGAAHHLLDIYRPTGRPGPWPVVLYVHGGGFSFLSKDTHWMMAEAFASHGFLVCTINYRLAPEHPYPAAVEDTCAAYRWLLDNAGRLGGDLSRVVVAGESAGANLVTSLSLAAAYPRPEPWARAVYEAGRVPDVAVPACGLFQVSDVERFWARRKLPAYVCKLLEGVETAYLRGHRATAPERLYLANPLLLLESGATPKRKLPAFFIPVGTKDPLLDDTRRLERALRAVGATATAAYYEGEIHAFHAALVASAAKECWHDTIAFVDQQFHRGRRNQAGDDPGDADVAA